MMRSINELYVLAVGKEPVQMTFNEYAHLCCELTGNEYFHGGLTIVIDPQPDQESK